MKEEIKQTLINGMENGELTGAFSDDLFDNLDQISEYLASQDILLNRDAVLIKKHYSGEINILTDRLLTITRHVDDIINGSCPFIELKVKDKSSELYLPYIVSKHVKALGDAKAYIELQKEEIVRQIDKKEDYVFKGFLLGILLSAILAGVSIYLFELFTK